jgi:excisionase family DNA binding protein
MTDDQFLTTGEVLDYLHINLRTVYRLIRAGTIPALRVGRQWRFRRKDIERFTRTGGRKLAAARGTSERPRILVVDDEFVVRDLVSKALATADYNVDTAEDGRSTLEHLRETAYDLLIIDLKMPGMGGLSVIRQARRDASDIPIIIITGNSTEATAIEALNLGVCGYLTKPFRMQRVLDIVKHALGRSSGYGYMFQGAAGTGDG